MRDQAGQEVILAELQAVLDRMDRPAKLRITGEERAPGQAPPEDAGVAAANAAWRTVREESA